MNKRIKCLFLVPSLSRAGAESQVVDLANGLDNELFEKKLFVFHNAQDQLDRVDQEHIQFSSCPRRYKLDVAPIREIARLIDKEGIDVIHCTMQFSLLLGWLARLMSRRKPPLVAAIHTTLNRSLKEEAQDRLIYRHLLKRSAAVIFVCRNQRDHWLAKYPVLKKTSWVIYNGIDATHFDPAEWTLAGQALRARLDIPAGAPVVACVAAFRPEKGHGYLIDAFAELPGDNYLVMAGDGETRPLIERYVEEKGLANRVRFLGVIEDVRALLSMSAVSVLASTAVETFSIAMLESMAMGTPMVATDIGGMNEAVLPGRTGFLVSPGSVESLRAALDEALGDASMLDNMGKAARNLVQEKFTCEMMVGQTAEVLQGAVRGKML